MKTTKRTGMKVKVNNGQWHKDIGRLHAYSNGAWIIIFTDSRGHYDKDLGVCVKSEIRVDVMPTKTAILKNGLVAFVGKGKKANLIMRNVAF